MGGGERDQEQVPRVRDGAEIEARVFLSSINRQVLSSSVARAHRPFAP